MAVELGDGGQGPVKRKQGHTRRTLKTHIPGIPTKDRVHARDIAARAEGLIVAISPIAGRTPMELFKKLPNQAFYFQCPPLEEMGRDKEWQWDDFGTIGSGMHSNPNYPGLAQIPIDTLFVDDSWGWTVGPRSVKLGATPGDEASRAVVPGPRFATADLPKDILWAGAWLEALGDSMQPFGLQWGQPQLWGRWDRVTAATLRSLRVAEKSGEIDARYIRVSFTEYPDADATPVAAPHVPGQRRGPWKDGHGHRLLAPPMDSSKLPPGKRTLAQLAKNYYGQASAWRLIAKASGLTRATPNQDLPSTVGRRHPPARILIPARTKAAPPRKRPPAWRGPR
jgi:hypothetical protein